MLTNKTRSILLAHKALALMNENARALPLSIPVTPLWPIDPQQAMEKAKRKRQRKAANAQILAKKQHG